jgi:hypothetical protein
MANLKDLFPLSNQQRKAYNHQLSPNPTASCCENPTASLDCTAPPSACACACACALRFALALALAPPLLCFAPCKALLLLQSRDSCPSWRGVREGVGEAVLRSKAGRSGARSIFASRSSYRKKGQPCSSASDGGAVGCKALLLRRVIAVPCFAPLERSAKQG